MIYVSGEYALNIPCKLKTTGDWHSACYELKNSMSLESNKVIFKNYGIEKHLINDKKVYIANHIRAILDIMLYGNIDFLYGFKKDFISVDEYDNEIFEKVYMIKSINSNFIDKEKWEKIDLLMNNEYKMKWINFKKEKADGNRCTS